MHDAASWFAYVASWTPAGKWGASLDGIVRISHSDGSYRATEAYQIINHDPNFISDHNAVSVDVEVTSAQPQSMQFNIITHNIEGMCAEMSRAISVRRLLPTWYAGHIKPGTLMVFQELALQKHKNDADKQEKFLEGNLQKLLGALEGQAAGCDLRGVTDKYTGSMIYDANEWTLEHTEEIRRPVIGDRNKRSNAYRMKHKKGNFSIWLVNIHLKALGGLSDLFKNNPKRDKTHVDELRNIIQRLVTLMRSTDHGAVPNDSKTPIYLCGDFNNPNSKFDLVQLAVSKVPGYTLPDPVKVPIESLEEWSLVDQSTFGATHRRGRKKKSEKIGNSPS
jgi:hypothetical protein